jgi:hypothetical protein
LAQKISLRFVLSCNVPDIRWRVAKNQRLAWKLPNTFVKFSATEAMILCRCWICFWQSAPNGYHNPIKENWKPGRMRVAIRPRKSLQNPWSYDGLLERPVSRGAYRAGIVSMTRDQSGEDKMSAQKSLDRKLSVYLIAFLIICIDIGLVAWVLGSYVY